jgi:hypothetical protein
VFRINTIEFPDGSTVLVTLLCSGQRATVLQLPVAHQAKEPARSTADMTAMATFSAG